MPEYLAPGVYVEETSFRSKSIEGVSTSTTAFVGLARKGPVTGSPGADTDPEKAETPEILTSYVDFERVFGGFEDIAVGGGARNYLAHAVNAFFSNGGSRLYVARVTGSNTSSATSLTFAGTASFKARVPGQAGNGRIVLSLGFSPITPNTWRNLPAGSVVRAGGGPAPTAARLEGSVKPRFAAANGDTLAITVNGVAQPAIEIKGVPAQIKGSGVLGPTLLIDDGNKTITVDVDGLAQKITLKTGVAVPRADVVADINQKLAGGFAFLDTDDRLVLATDTRGLAAKIRIEPSALLGFPPADPPEARSKDNAGAAADNNVKNVHHLDLADLKGLIESSKLAVSLTDAGALVLTTRDAVGEDAKILVAAGPLQEALGLPTTEAKGGAGTAPTYQVKATATADFPALPPGTPVDLVSLAITAFDADGHARLYDDLGLDHRHPRFVGKVLTDKPTRKTEALEALFFLDGGAALDGAAWAEQLAGVLPPFQRLEGVPDSADRIERKIGLAGGSDGDAPTFLAFKKAFTVLERLDDISIVAAPGYSSFADADAIEQELIIHVEKRRSYRIGVLDSRQGHAIGEVRGTKAKIDSKYAALYYPWVVVANPLWRQGDASIPREIAVPPSGFVCGIYARNDVERGVFKTPANEVVRGALRFETDVNFAQQEVLNPLGVNCLRFFPGRGYRVWGGRTTTSDPEWKYVSVRRYFNYLERSIDVGTQWAVFEPNGERLWANVKETISSFLYNEWRSGALLGTDPKEAFFVRCDRSTMDQNDLDNGRLVCLIGVAVVKPAEFVIFRIGQKTADART